MAYDVDYVWQDGLLTHQNMIYYLRITSKNETRVVEIPFSAKFVYDESNTPVGCLVNGEAALAFVRNLQGDVIAIVTHEGDVLAEYSYDPWGKVTISHDGETLEGLNAAVMALYCPFAYRGYNYDFTTGLYYLQSRYYNPEWGRFLNVDDTNILLATQGENLGANLFAYCSNNPVNNKDPEGMRQTFKPGQSIGAWVGNLIGVLFILAPYLNETFFEVEKNRNLCIVRIHYDYKKSVAFYYATLNCIAINEALTYAALAAFAGQMVLEKMNRYFLFSLDCMYDEIKLHFELYSLTYTYRLMRELNLVPSSAEVNILYSSIYDHSARIDIAESDVYKKDQAILFNYRDGIRSCYKNTKADPYRIATNKRSTDKTVPENRTDWERWLNTYGRETPK